MRRRSIPAVAGAVLCTAALAGPAPAVTLGPPETGARLAYAEVVAYEQPMDPAGRPLGPKVRVDATAPPATKRVRATQASSGCKTVWVSRIGKSMLGFTIWKYTQEKYFCWSYPQVTTTQVNAYPCCTDPTWRWVGQIGAAAYYFTWAGSSRGGHYSFRQGKFEQRLGDLVLDTAQPWTKIWAYGNGSWAYATGS